MTALVIGFGNLLRSDDGAGHRLALALARRSPEGVMVLARPQLTPELAEPLTRASRVLFVDAVWASPTNTAPQLTPLEPLTAAAPFSHGLTPARLLALSAALYGHAPPAWQLLIPAHQGQLGNQLSAATAAACRAALPLLQRWSGADA